jgi:hypothetical protein
VYVLTSDIINRYFKARGLNEHGCPIYTNVSDGNWTLPLTPFESPEDDANGGVAYDAQTDVLWMGDYTDKCVALWI